MAEFFDWVYIVMADNLPRAKVLKSVKYHSYMDFLDKKDCKIGMAANLPQAKALKSVKHHSYYEFSR